ncbi:MAG: cytochrome c [Ferruginibacter sp.]|nr:cytochrome c [Ferruginibacter sp.]
MHINRQKVNILAILLLSFVSYSLYLYIELPVKYNAAKKEKHNGKFVWQKYNCNACHQVYGLGGYLGPDLTNTYSLKGNDYIRAFLKNGTATMPDFHLSAQEMQDILYFLKDIDESGIANPKTFTLNYDGTIKQQ